MTHLLAGLAKSRSAPEKEDNVSHVCFYRCGEELVDRARETTMPSCRLVSTLALLLAASEAYRNGFSIDQCDNMDPTEPDGAAHGNTTDMPQLEMSTDSVPFVIELSSAKYKRARTMQIFVSGASMSALLLQVRKYSNEEDAKPVRVGEFKSWPQSIKPLRCDEDKVTALTNSDLSSKSNLSISWQAPPEDAGEIQVVGTFVHQGVYWLMAESPTLSCDHFPVSLLSCGKEKSCYLRSNAPSCHADSCDYILTYKVVDNNRSVEFVLGGSAKEGKCYVAVGFSQDKEARNMSFISCSTSDGENEIKYYVVQNQNEPPLEQTMPFEDEKIDIDEGRLWCSFIIPLTVPGVQSLDLSIPQFHIYLWGHTKDDVPILPSSENMLMSKEELSIEELTVNHHFTENAASCAFSITILLLISIVSTIFNYL